MTPTEGSKLRQKVQVWDELPRGNGTTEMSCQLFESIKWSLCGLAAHVTRGHIKQMFQMFRATYYDLEYIVCVESRFTHLPHLRPAYIFFNTRLFVFSVGGFPVVISHHYYYIRQNAGNLVGQPVNCIWIKCVEGIGGFRRQYFDFTQFRREKNVNVRSFGQKKPNA